MKEIFELGCAACGAFFMAIVLTVFVFMFCILAIFILLWEEKNMLLKRHER